jgi:hypothetical protein
MTKTIPKRKHVHSAHQVFQVDINALLLLLTCMRPFSRSEYDADDDEEDAVFGASSTTNNPFADNADDANVDSGNSIGLDAGFNPFATIADEEAVTADGQQGAVFDPFQTILDDDALNVPFSSTDQDAEDDVTSPSRYIHLDGRSAGAKSFSRSISSR